MAYDFAEVMGGLTAEEVSARIIFAASRMRGEAGGDSLPAPASLVSIYGVYTFGRPDQRVGRIFLYGILFFLEN